MLIRADNVIATKKYHRPFHHLKCPNGYEFEPLQVKTISRGPENNRSGPWEPDTQVPCREVKRQPFASLLEKQALEREGKESIPAKKITHYPNQGIQKSKLNQLV